MSIHFPSNLAVTTRDKHKYPNTILRPLRGVLNTILYDQVYCLPLRSVLNTILYDQVYYCSLRSVLMIKGTMSRHSLL